MCIHIDIFMHCALYVFYEANKDDYYNVAYFANSKQRNRLNTNCIKKKMQFCFIWSNPKTVPNHPLHTC